VPKAAELPASLDVSIAVTIARTAYLHLVCAYLVTLSVPAASYFRESGATPEIA